MLKSDAVKKDKPRRLSHPKCEYGNTQDIGNLLYLKLFSDPTAVLQQYYCGTIAIVLEPERVGSEVGKRKKLSAFNAEL